MVSPSSIVLIVNLSRALAELTFIKSVPPSSESILIPIAFDVVPASTSISSPVVAVAPDTFIVAPYAVFPAISASPTTSISKP